LRRATDRILPDFVKSEHKHPFFSNNWRAFSRTRRGREIVEELTSVRALRKSGIFDPKWVPIYMGFWKSAPESSKFFKRLDLFVGFILGVQALDSQFVAQRPSGDSQFPMVDRTLGPKAHGTSFATSSHGSDVAAGWLARSMGREKASENKLL